MTNKYPFYTPYQFAGNTPIGAIDLDGAEAKSKINFATITKDRSAIEVNADIDIKIQIINLSAISNSEINLTAIAGNLKSDLEAKFTGRYTALWKLPFSFKSKGNIITGVETQSLTKAKEYSVTYEINTKASVTFVNKISEIDNDA